jgi:hypothetical protein
MAADDGHARGRDAGGACDEAAQRVVGAPVDRRRRHVGRVAARGGRDEALARGARGETDGQDGGGRRHARNRLRR